MSTQDPADNDEPTSRYPIILNLVFVLAISSCSGNLTTGVTTPSPAVKAGFHFQPGNKLRMSMVANFEIFELALGVDDAGLWMKVKQSARYEVTIGKADKDGLSAAITPLACDYSSGKLTFSYKDGKLTRSPEAEERGIDLPTKPFELSFAENGLLKEVGPDSGPASWMFIDPMFSHPGSLLGWLGPLPDAELKEGMEWTNPRQVLLAREDAMPLNAVARRVRKTSSGWSVNFTVEVDRTSKRYDWLKNCAESGLGFLDLDKHGRPVRATVHWTALTPEGKAIGEYSWSCDYEF